MTLNKTQIKIIEIIKNNGGLSLRKSDGIRMMEQATNLAYEGYLEKTSGGVFARGVYRFKPTEKFNELIEKLSSNQKVKEVFEKTFLSTQYQLKIDQNLEPYIKLNPKKGFVRVVDNEVLIISPKTDLLITKEKIVA